MNHCRFSGLLCASTLLGGCATLVDLGLLGAATAASSDSPQTLAAASGASEHAASASEASSTKAPPKTGNADVDAFQASIDQDYPEKRRLTLTGEPANITQKELLEQGGQIKGWFWVFDLSSVDFLKRTSIEEKNLSMVEWIKTEFGKQSRSPIAFQMPVNDWVRKRKQRKEDGGAGFSYACTTMGPGNCDLTTVVAIPTGRVVTLPVGDAGLMRRMPVAEIIAVSDKYGVWRKK